MKLRFYSDSGHGWLRVPKDLVKTKISTFSYQDDLYFYLEEDLDAPVFLKSLPEKPEIQHFNVNGRSKIRSYDRVMHEKL